MNNWIDADELISEINDVYNGYMLEEQTAPIEFETMVEELANKTTVKAVPINELIKLRDKIQKLHDDTDTKAKAEESYRGFNEKADLACFLYRNDFIKPLNDLIEQYGFKEKEEETER